MKRNKFRIGFSTGTLESTGLSINDRLVFLKDLGCNAIELGYFKKERLGYAPLNSIDLRLLKGFSWVSLHAPSMDFRYDSGDKSSLEVLFAIEEFYKTFSLDTVIFHPDTLGDFSVLEKCKIPVALENMDKNKISFRDPKSFLAVFEKHSKFKMILDLNHCFVNDPSMQLAKNFLSAFGERIIEYHISGYKELHDPLCLTNQDIIINQELNESLPVIIESTVASLAEAKNEYNYVVEYLNSR